MQQNLISHQKLYEYISYMLERGLGYPRATAEISAHVLIEAELRGHPSHGVGRIKKYYEEVTSGKSNPKGIPEIVYETPISIVIQGNRAPGFKVAEWAMENTIAKAKANGTCMTAVKNSCHFGMAGYWAELAADQNMIGMAFTNTLRTSIPTFGRERLLGTNPICVAIPLKNKPHFMLDMATTTAAMGKVEVAARRSEELPKGWAVDENGDDTSDAAYVAGFTRSDKEPYHGGLLFMGGATTELGGHKGYGLGLLVELITAGLSMGMPTYDTGTSQDGCQICHYFQATRMDLFGDAAKIQEHIAGILDYIKSSPKADGQDRIYIHGEKEFERRAKAIKEGIELDKATLAKLDEYADIFKLEHLVL